MMSRVLFLDDNNERGIAFLADHPGALWLKTAAGTIEALANGERWDLVSLDHDLGDQVFVDSNRPGCGMEVVRWIIANRPEIDRIVVHSWNYPAASRMTADLQRAGYKVARRMFGM